MNHPKILLAAGALAALIGGAARAATVDYPYLDIEQGTAVGTGTPLTLTMQGTAVTIAYGPGNNVALTPTAAFTLTATYASSPTANTYDYTNGTITIGNPGSPLLTATFNDLVLQSAGTSLFNYVIASSPLTYTGGSLKGSLSGGEITGSFTVTSAAVHSPAGYADLSHVYAGNNLTAKVGAVAVPLPASAWLLLSGVGALGLAFFRRRIGTGQGAGFAAA